MYKSGHYGTALIAYAPIALLLLSLQLFVHAAIAGVIIVGLTRIPDWDMWVPFIKHRGITHTFVFVGIMGLVVGSGLVGALYMLSDVMSSLFGYTVTPLALAKTGGFGFALGALSILAHMLGDIITPMGLKPYQPFNDTRKRYPITTAASPVGNAVLFAVGLGLSVGAIIAGIYLSGIDLPMLAEQLQSLAESLNYPVTAP